MKKKEKLQREVVYFQLCLVTMQWQGKWQSKESKTEILFTHRI